MNIKIKPVFLPTLIIAISIALTFILVVSKEDAKKVVIEKPSLTIETLYLKSRDYRIYINSESEIEPKTEYVITPYVAGEIVYASNFLDNNLIFSKGTLLIQIDSSDYSIARVNAKARLDAAILDYKLIQARSDISQAELTANNYDNATDLAKKIPQLKSSKSLMDAAEANHEKTLLDLKRTSIIAPFNGRVDANFSEKGMRVSGFDRLARIYSTDLFKIEFPISISDIQYLGIVKDSLGFINKADLKIDIKSKIGDSVYLYDGQFSGISGSVDKLTQTVKLNVILDNNKLSIPIDKGLFVESKIFGKTYEDVFVIPNQAINHKKEVYLVKGDILLKKEVEIIKRYKDSTIIKSGLENGNMISITPIPIYIDSMKVNVLDK